MIVKQILAMKKGPAQIVTVRPDDTISQAVQLLAGRGIGAVVVSQDGQTADGILSERDIVRELGRGGNVMDRKVRDVMTAKVTTCTCGEDALSVLETMTAGRFRHMPVVDEAGKMVGVISIGDTVFARLKELGAEKDALTGMIMGA